MEIIKFVAAVAVVGFAATWFVTMIVVDYKAKMREYRETHNCK